MKTRDIHFKIEEDEYQRIRREAFEAGLSIGEYARRKLSGMPHRRLRTTVRKSKNEVYSDTNRDAA